MKILKFIALIFVLLCANGAYSDNKQFPIVAIVDVQVIMDQSLAVQSIRDAINRIGQALQKEMSDKEQSLKAIEQSLIKKRDKMKEDEYDEEVRKFNSKVSDAQRMMQEKKSKLEKAHANAMMKVNEKISQIINTLSSEKHFSVVLPSSHILYAKDNLDITEAVLSKLNTELQSVQVNYK